MDGAGAAAGVRRGGETAAVAGEGLPAVGGLHGEEPRPTWASTTRWTPWAPDGDRARTNADGVRAPSSADGGSWVKVEVDSPTPVVYAGARVTVGVKVWSPTPPRHGTDGMNELVAVAKARTTTVRPSIGARQPRSPTTNAVAEAATKAHRTPKNSGVPWVHAWLTARFEPAW